VESRLEILQRLAWCFRDYRDCGRIEHNVESLIRRRVYGMVLRESGVTAVAAAMRLRDTGAIGRDEIVVCNLTGHGLKQPEAIRLSDQELTPIAPKTEALREQLQKAERLRITENSDRE
jgi:threonine synthase